jgi:hypothetical protein
MMKQLYVPPYEHDANSRGVSDRPHVVQTGSGPLLVSYPMGAGGSFSES